MPGFAMEAKKGIFSIYVRGKEVNTTNPTIFLPFHFVKDKFYQSKQGTFIRDMCRNYTLCLTQIESKLSRGN